MTEWQFKNDLTKESLIIIEPSFRLISWSLDSGSIYKMTPPETPRKSYRDGVLMIEVSSKVEVDDETKWFFDNTDIYVFNDPTSDWVVMRFEKYFGSRGFKLPRDVDLSGSEEIVYFEPRIAGDPGFDRSGKDRLQGISVTGDGSFSLLDTNEELLGSLADDIETYSFVEAPVRIWRYLEEEQGTPIELMFKGALSRGWEIDRTRIAFQGKDFLNKIEDSVQSIEYNTTDFPNCDPEMIGKVQRLIYGRCMVKVVNIDFVEEGDQTENRIWRVSEHINKEVLEV